MTYSKKSFSSPEKEVAETFDQWAEQGRGETMADGHQELFEALFQNWSGNDDSHLLDIGCGVGKALEYAQSFNFKKLYGTDISEQMISLAQQKLPHADFKLSNCNPLPWDDNIFTHVFSVESLYYHDCPKTSLKEIFRCLKDQGVFSLVIEYYKDNPGSYDWKNALGVFMNSLSNNEWCELLSKVGFKEIKSNRIIRKQAVLSEKEFTSSPYFTTYQKYLTFIKEGALQITAFK